eukprot:scaffold23471_cov141-Cylindrotheca_fusiformis.AAC.14
MSLESPPRVHLEEDNNDRDVSPLRSSPPPPGGRRRRPRSAAVAVVEVSKNDKKRAETLAQQIDAAIPIMLDRLFSYLSSLPEEEMEERGGLTLPASALGWLSAQFETETAATTTAAAAESSAMWASTRDRVRLLKFLLPRVTHLRINRNPWPPPIPPSNAATTTPSSSSPLVPTAPPANESRSRPRSRRPPPPLETLQTSDDGDSVCSALTTETSFPTRAAFLKFMQALTERPTLDLRLFPYLQVLVLDSVPPYWISDFGTIAKQIKILRIDKACLYQLPALFREEQQEPQSPYEALTHLRLNDCGIDELCKLPKFLRQLPNLQFLNLANNNLLRERTVLKGLTKLEKLEKLDLSGNSLIKLPHANLYLGANLKALRLNGNAITELKGIDKLYSLETLDISSNQISDVLQLVAVTRLPFLLRFLYAGNPFLVQRPPGYKKKQTTSYEPEYRLLILSWFRSNRDDCPNPEGLPVLNNQEIDEEEWIRLQAMTKNRQFLKGSTATTTIQRVKRTCLTRKRKVRAMPRIIPPQVTPIRISTTNQQLDKQVVASFSTEDVLLLLYREKEAAFPEDYPYKTPVETANGPAKQDIKETKESISPTVVVVEEEEEEGLERNNVQGEESGNEIGDISTSVASSILPSTTTTALDSELHQLAQAEQVDLPVRPEVLGTTSLDGQLEEADGPLSISLMEEPTQDTDTIGIQDTTKGDGLEGTLPEPMESSNANTDVADTADTTNDSSQQVAAATEATRSSEEPIAQLEQGGEINKTESPNVGSVELQFGGTRQNDLFGAEWEAIVAMAAAGMIPNGKLRNPIANVPQANPQEEIFSTAFDLLPASEGGESTTMDTPGGDGTAIDDASEMGSTFPSTPVDAVYNDDFSVPSSLGTTDFPVQTKFQLAEDNSVYDGPETCRNLNVLKNLDLYFSSFVFRKTNPASQPTAEIKEEDFNIENSQYPRIQLWPEDRRLVEANYSASPSQPMSDWVEQSRERFVRVWEEDIVPCGKSALRRLAPNRRIRLSFHGDKLFKDGMPDAYAESRKVFLCLSSTAFYVISRKDEITLQNAKKKKKFPVPIKDKSAFGDAPWPHAVARHTYRDLNAIAIGFDFQRLTLRFSSSRRSEPFVYVLLTSNKKATVKILQDIQLLAKEANEGVADLVSDATAVAIENDSQAVFDALSTAVAPDLLGTVLHYQIVQQRWKRGDRGTVRRVCVITDAKILLLDEDYVNDAHAFLQNTSTRAGEVSYQVVDEASLPQVAEVQAAVSDPRSITIIINPLSRLSRIHRWRIICRDSSGAERLVEDVRKALRIIES